MKKPLHAGKVSTIMTDNGVNMVLRSQAWRAFNPFYPGYDSSRSYPFYPEYDSSRSSSSRGKYLLLASRDPIGRSVYK